MQPIQALWFSMFLIYMVVTGRMEKTIETIKAPFSRVSKSGNNTITKGSNDTGAGSRPHTGTGSNGSDTTPPPTRPGVRPE